MVNPTYEKEQFFSSFLGVIFKMVLFLLYLGLVVKYLAVMSKTRPFFAFYVKIFLYLVII